MRTKVSDNTLHLLTIMVYIAAGKLTGHLTSVSAITVERNANMNIMLSGAVDTNVKIWDIR